MNGNDNAALSLKARVELSACLLFREEVQVSNQGQAACFSGPSWTDRKERTMQDPDTVQKNKGAGTPQETAVRLLPDRYKEYRECKEYQHPSGHIVLLDRLLFFV